MGTYVIDIKVTVDADSDPEANEIGGMIVDALMEMDGVMDVENFYPEVVYE